MRSTNGELKMKKELVYLLGYFYADGYLKKYNNEYIYPTLEMVKSDSENILVCLKKLGIKYTTNCRFRKNSKNEQICIRISSDDKNANLFKLVITDKINMSNILNHINKKDLCYFLRGFFDGDGCISIRKGNSNCLYFYGSFDQNWSLVFDILKNLNIKYTFQQIIRKNGEHKSTHICISNKCGINILYEYMYPNRKFDFGLFRKYEKLNSIKGLIKSNHIKKYSEYQNADVVKIYKNS